MTGRKEMKESQKQARITLAATALARLANHVGPLFRKELFLAPKNATQTEYAEAQKSRWQNEFLSRLVDGGVIKKAMVEKNQNGYVGNRKLIDPILHNLHKKDGSLLARYLWGEKVDISGSEAQQLMNEYQQPEEQEESKEDGEIVEIFLRLEQAINLALENQNALVARFDDKFKDIPELIKKIGAYNRRLDEVENRLTELNKLVNANQNVIKPAMDSVVSLSDSAHNIKDVIETINTSNERTAKLHDTIEQLNKQLEKERKNETGKLLTKLESHIKESEQLREMTLELIANEQ